MSFIPFLQAAGSGASSASGSGSLLTGIVPFILIIVIFYFFLIRPQNKKQKETEKMLNALKKGDKVVTIGGIHGVVTSVKEDKTVVLKVDENCKMEFNRSAISSVELSDEEKAKLQAEAEAKKAAKEAKKAEKLAKKSGKTETADVVKEPEEKSSEEK